MQRCLDVRDACGDAIAWIEANRRQVPRLDRESTSLTLRLRRARNKARLLAHTAERPFGVGFFGLSQAGKSYLISALAASEDGRFDMALGPDRLSFLTHINPPGGGKEATGLVTRLTRRQSQSPAGFPLRLNLFSEADLVKVLGNAFFKNFDREQASFDVDESRVRQHLAKLEQQKRSTPLPGMDADDVVDLQDYFEKRFPRSTRPLKADFWPTAGALATHLDGNDRAELFSLLWGEVPELTDVFQRLRDSLAKLRFAPTVWCEISALVTPTEEGGWSPRASIVDVDVLEQLGKDMDDTLRVLPNLGDATAATVSIPRSILAALTAEVELVVADAPKEKLLERVDLLDFPGYRGRLSISNLGEVRKQLKDDQLDPVAQLVLRGKVAYLFERYTEGQEMNALVLCMPSNQQSDVSDMGDVIESWIHTTQGPDPEARSQHRPGLLWALTKFDQRLDVVPGQNEDLMRGGWEGMMKLALLEHFDKYDWLREWTPDRRFDNLFLVRKPGKAGAVIRTDGEQELEVLPTQAQRLQQLRKTFCQHSLVREYIGDPAAAWDAMLTLNDGGVSRLNAHLNLVVDPEARLRGIGDQIEMLAGDIARGRLRDYHKPQGPDIEGKERIIAKILHALRRKGDDRIGDLIHLLQPTREDLRALYLRADLGPDDDGGLDPSGSADDDDDAPLDLDEILGTRGPGADRATGAVQESDRAAAFARSAIRGWVLKLKELADQESTQRYFGLRRMQFDDLIDEVVTGADRHGLEQTMTAALRTYENLAGTRREQIASRQADVVYSVLAGFVDYLDAFETPSDEENGPHTSAQEGADAANGQNGFEGPASPELFASLPPIASGSLPELPPEQDRFSERYVLDWYRALVALAKNNAGYSADQAISPEQNRRLGTILTAFEGSGSEMHGA